MTRSRGNLFEPSAGGAGAAGLEFVERLLENGPMRIERIVSRGHASSPGFWYDQDDDEWVAVLSGSARLAFDDGTLVHLGPGDYVHLEAHRRHRVEWTDPEVDTVWLAVFTPPAGAGR